MRPTTRSARCGSTATRRAPPALAPTPARRPAATRRRTPPPLPLRCRGEAVSSDAIALASPEPLAAALRGADYLADEGLVAPRFPGACARQAVAARRRAGRRQDRGRQGVGARARLRAHPPAVLRGHRRLRRRSTTGTTRASSCHVAGSQNGRRGPHRRSLRPRIPDRDAAAEGAAQRRDAPSC